jgi:prolyl-tRNA synthetase
MKTKEIVDFDGLDSHIEQLLKDIQSHLLLKAKAFRDLNTKKIDSYDQFKKEIDNSGFFLAHWDGTSETEEKIKEETKATIRCIPFDVPAEEGVCMVTGKPSKGRVVFAKAY